MPSKTATRMPGHFDLGKDDDFDVDSGEERAEAKKVRKVKASIELQKTDNEAQIAAYKNRNHIKAEKNFDPHDFSAGEEDDGVEGEAEGAEGSPSPPPKSKSKPQKALPIIGTTKAPARPISDGKLTKTTAGGGTGPADAFRHGKAMKKFAGIDKSIIKLLTRFYHISGKPKATRAYDKAEADTKTIKKLREELAGLCETADQQFEDNMSGKKRAKSKSRRGDDEDDDAREEDPVQDVSAIMAKLTEFGRPMRLLNQHVRQIMDEMGYVDRYVQFGREHPVIIKVFEQIVTSSVKMAIPLPKVPI
jgi:hypothetical protein